MKAKITNFASWLLASVISLPTFSSSLFQAESLSLSSHLYISKNLLYFSLLTGCFVYVYVIFLAASFGERSCPMGQKNFATINIYFIRLEAGKTGVFQPPALLDKK